MLQTRHDEAQALKNAERRGEQRGAETERQKWQAELEKLRQENAELRAQRADS